MQKTRLVFGIPCHWVNGNRQAFTKINGSIVHQSTRKRVVENNSWSKPSPLVVIRGQQQTVQTRRKQTGDKILRKKTTPNKRLRPSPSQKKKTQKKNTCHHNANTLFNTGILSQLFILPHCLRHILICRTRSCIVCCGSDSIIHLPILLTSVS